MACRFSTWSLVKLADFLVAEGVADDISHEGLRVLLREEGVPFQRVKTWKTTRDPDYEAKKARVEHLYAIADEEVIPEGGEPAVVFCMDEFGPLNLQPHPGRQWAELGGKHKDPERDPRLRRRATYTRPYGVRHLFAAYDLGKNKLYGHIKKTKNRSKFPEFCRYMRSLYVAYVRIAIVCDDYSPHPTTKRCRRSRTGPRSTLVVAGAITAPEPSWMAPFTGLSPRQFGKLVTVLRRKGAEAVRRGRPWSLTLEDRGWPRRIERLVRLHRRQLYPACEASTHLIGQPVDSGGLVVAPVPGVHGQREVGVLLRDLFQPGLGNRRPSVQIPPNSRGVRPQVRTAPIASHRSVVVRTAAARELLAPEP